MIVISTESRRFSGAVFGYVLPYSVSEHFLRSTVKQNVVGAAVVARAFLRQSVVARVVVKQNVVGAAVVARAFLT